MLPLRFFMGTSGLSGFLSDQRPTRTLREVLRRLQETYCGSIGFEVCAHCLLSMSDVITGSPVHAHP